jgi:uncharacterized protein YbjT (DUF2867 family)
MILLTGFTGNTGGQVAAQLAAAGVPFKVMVRSDAARARAEALGYTAVHGDFDRRISLEQALREGFEKAYLVCTPDERTVERECNFIDAARAAGVRRVVKLSAFLSDLGSESPNLRAHARIEKHLAESGMEWTVVRPHGFMQTFVLISLDFVRGVGAYVHAAGDGGMPLVDVRDLGKVGFKCLTEDGHHGKIYSVTGPENVSFARQAEILGQAFGRPVTYVKGDELGQRIAMKVMGVAPQSVEHVEVIMRWVRERKMEEATTTLADLGIRPTTFAAFAADLAAGRTGGGSSFEPPTGLAVTLLNGAMTAALKARFAILGRPS